MEPFECDGWYVTNIEAKQWWPIGMPGQVQYEQEQIVFTFRKKGQELDIMKRPYICSKGTFREKEKEKDGLCRLFKEMLEFQRAMLDFKARNVTELRG